MTVWVVEFDHKHGTEIWVAENEQLAENIVTSVQKHIFKRRDQDNAWSLSRAMNNWTEYSGSLEFFRIKEFPLINTSEAAKKAQA